MRMMRRAGLLQSGSFTLAQLFATVNSAEVSGANVTTAATLSKTLPSSASVGDTWYYFFFAGGSLEIARIDYSSSNAITKTQLATVTASGATQRTFSVSGTTANSGTQLYGGNIVSLRFNNKYPTTAIDAVLTNCLKSCVKYADTTGNSTWSNGTTRIPQADVASYTGLCFVAFTANSSYSSGGGSNNWSVSNWETPLTPITAYQNSNSLNRTVIIASTNDNVNYYSPTLNGTGTTAYGHSYSMFRLYDA